MTRNHCLAAAIAMVIAMAPWSACRADAQTFDGITIIEFSDDLAKQALAHGDHIVAFVSARGSYGAVVPRRGTHGGCQALAVPESYTGASITFGMAADPAVRQQRLQAYCPVFTMQFENSGTARIIVPDYPASGKNYETRQKVIAHVPLRSVDFESEPFVRHDIKGVRLGPVLDTQGLGALGAPSDASDRYKFLTRKVTAKGGESSIQGRAAAAEVTGWPWDVLYFAQYIEPFGGTSTFDAFKDAVRERYGEPSTIDEDSGFMLWLYDLDGRKLRIAEVDPIGCRATVEFRLRADLLKRVQGMDWEFNSYDIGPWGCSLMMTLNPDRNSGGVKGYSVQVGSGYIMAINHFLQRIDQTKELLQKVEALRARKPRF